MSWGHWLICVKTHDSRPSGHVEAPIKGPRQGADCSDCKDLKRFQKN
jgi:hypothetical protein